MIDGAASGLFATHPSIAERIKAVIAVTGSMALIAPSRRDTRGSERSGGGFGRRREPPLQQAAAPAARAAAEADRNWLGLSRAATVAAAAALVAFTGWQGYRLRDPGRVLAEFDPRPAITMTVVSVHQAGCGLAMTLGGPRCAAGEMKAMTDRLARQPGRLSRIFAAMPEGDMGTFRSGDGVLSDSASAEAIAAEVKAKRCFTTDSYSVGRFGLHPVVPGQADADYSIDRWLSSGDYEARAVIAAGPAPDAALAAYLKERKERLRMAHAYFGEPGLQYALQRYGQGEHAAALGVLRLRLQDPSFAASLAPAARAEMQLLAADPDAFIPCRARARPAPPPG
jgi:hypothetical protein